MDPISNVDALVLLLRKRLAERARSTASGKPADRSVGDQPQAQMDGVHALAAVAGISDHQLGRALIQRVLAEQFGAQAINEPKFQAVVTRVTETLEQEPSAALLLSRVLKDLRAAAVH